MERKHFRAGEVIFKQGDSSPEFYRIESGNVTIIANYGKETETEIATINPGKFFGEMGVIENTKRSATAVAKGDVDVLAIDSKSFPQFVEVNPDDAIRIMQNISKSLRATTKDYIDACKTIAELLNDDDNEKPKKKSLLDKLRKFADEYLSVDYYNPDIDNQMYMSSFYDRHFYL